MKKNGLYGYYDTVNEYVVYIGKDADIGNNKRYNDHKKPSKYDNQAINRVVQNHPERYVYFKFIEGKYDDKTLNELEREAIKIFKTYKYDYPRKNVFNFRKGGDGGSAEGKHNPNWRKEDYKVIKAGMHGEKQRYAITGRCRNTIKWSQNRQELEELSNKLNKKEITEEDVKKIELCSIKERLKRATKAWTKYNIWDVSCCQYDKQLMPQCNGKSEPRRCFKYAHNGKKVPIGGFHDFVTCQIIDSIVKEEVKKCQPDN